MIPREIYAETLATLLGPVRELVADPSVSEVMINGPERIFVERGGRVERTALRFSSAEAVLAALRNVAQFSGVFIDERQPILEARLPDGSRIEAVIAPLVEDGPVVSIRRFARHTLTLERLVELGSMDADTAEALRVMTLAKCNIVVSGGTGSGKTSLLNVLAGCVPEGERVLVLEDTREIQIDHPHVVHLQTRKASEEGADAIGIRDLFRAALRMRPDRMLVGEIRGAEALDLTQAMVSGHRGCLSTLHASTPRDALTRLETMSMMSDVELPLPAIRMQIGSGVDVLVQVSRLHDGTRKVTHVTEVTGFDLDAGHYQMHDLLRRRYLGHDEAGRVRSALVPTGVRPGFADLLEAHGVSLPASMCGTPDSHDAHGDVRCRS